MDKTLEKLPVPKIETSIKQPRTIHNKKKDNNIKFLDDIISNKFLNTYFKKKIKR
jgi:hypothetical protein